MLLLLFCVPYFESRKKCYYWGKYGVMQYSLNSKFPFSFFFFFSLHINLQIAGTEKIFSQQLCSMIKCLNLLHYSSSAWRRDRSATELTHPDRQVIQTPDGLKISPIFISTSWNIMFEHQKLQRVSTYNYYPLILYPT